MMIVGKEMATMPIETLCLAIVVLIGLTIAARHLRAIGIISASLILMWYALHSGGFGDTLLISSATVILAVLAGNRAVDRFPRRSRPRNRYFYLNELE